MLIVYIPGVWDLLHVGHLSVLKRAGALGDRLVVGVPSDEVVAEDKGASPIITLADRVCMLEALLYVDLVFPYYALEFLTHLNMIRPDVLAVGETWGNETRHKGAEEWIQRYNRRMVKLPYYRHESTTKIKQRIQVEFSE